MADEKKTVKIMIELYCVKKHGTKEGLCEECEELLVYAGKRVDSCKFQDNKGTCGKCKVPCYKPEMREKIKAVMKFSGPRMLYTHPLLACRHLVQGLKIHT